MTRNDILDYLNTIFQYKDFTEKYSVNGLQIEGRDSINKIAFSVDTNLFTIEEAVRQKADMLISHHGLFWPNLSSITEITKKRIQLLMNSDISLVGMHLPLDKHPEIGNNVSLIKLLNGKLISEFGSVSYLAEWEEEKDLKEVSDTLNTNLNTNTKCFDFSKGKAKTFGVCTGNGSSELYSLFGKQCDLFITGELRYETIGLSREYGISLMVAGHYATETLGIKQLQNRIKNNLSVETIYIEDRIDY